MPSIKLTDRFVASAKPDEGKEREDFFDATCAGLILRVSAKRKTWVVRYRVASGRQPRQTLGTYPAISLSDARDQANDILKRASKGADPAAEQKQARRSAREQPIKTLDDLAAAYFVDTKSGDYRARKRKKADSTIAGEEGLYKRHIQKALGGEPLEHLTADVLKRHVRAVAKKAGVQGNRTHSLLSQFFSYAVKERQRLPFNPMGAVAKPVDEEPRDRVLTDAEMKRIWTGLDAPSDLKIVEGGEERPVYIGKSVVIALRISSFLLQRRSEVAGMMLDELDLDQRLWIIPKERTKARREHVVPLPDAAIDWIRLAMEVSAEAVARWRRRHPDAELPNATPLFPSPRDPSKPIGGGALTHAFNDLCAGLKIEDARVHDLRRTGSTTLTGERGGQRRFIVSQVLNHDDDDDGAKITGVYDRNKYLPEKRIALARWASILTEIVEGREGPTNVHPLKVSA